uniref:Uncharacterized protein n=1 Tax=Peronospora matthiolae TaxID=2874970 RepID=A0AAV1UHJ5_9STRA
MDTGDVVSTTGTAVYHHPGTKNETRPTALDDPAAMRYIQCLRRTNPCDVWSLTRRTVVLTKEAAGACQEFQDET